MSSLSPFRHTSQEWGKDPSRHSWEMLQPFLDRWGEHRAELIATTRLLLDEDMWGWKAKNSVRTILRLGF